MTPLNEIESWDSIRKIQREVTLWADSLFPNRTAFGAISKLMLEEMPEFLRAQHDPGEYADLVILILDIATLNGIDVASAVRDKMEINRGRKWTIDPVSGLMKHTKENSHET